MSRADVIAQVCIFGGAVVLATGVLVRPARITYRRAVHRNLGKAMLAGAVGLASMADSVQQNIDQMSGVPNLGLLVRLGLVPVINYYVLSLQDDLVSAPAGRRRWHRGFAAGAAVLTVALWYKGVPHDHSLPTIPVAVPLGGANGWLYALAWLFCLELIVQCGSTARTAYRIVLHVYATGYDRVTCLSTVLFGLAQACFCAVGLGLLLYPPGQATGHTEWIDLSTYTTELFGVVGAGLALAAYAAPLWANPQRRPQAASQPSAGRLERLLRLLVLVSCYGAVRRLALQLQDVLPAPAVPLGYGETRVWHVRRVSDLDLLLQLFKTVINDARVALAPYVSDAASGPAEPAQTARALDDALAHYWRGQKPARLSAAPNPLRETRPFNDERFLAALWHEYKGLRRRTT